MPVKITDQSTKCDLCLPEYPTHSVAEGSPYRIHPDTCDECEVQEGGPQCALVYPVECIVKSE